MGNRAGLEGSGTPSREIRVLLVDDEPGFAETAARFVERESGAFTVETATDAVEGLQRLTDDVDCIVSDYDMPGRNGIEFLEAVREVRPDLPFIIFTGEGSEEVASNAISAEVTDYLQKDAGTDQYARLANRIEHAVDAERSRRVLTEHTRRLETLIDNLPGIVYRCRNEPEWPIENVEGEVESLTGYAAEALESGDVVWGDEILHPDDRDPSWEVVQDGLSGDGSFELTYRIVTKDGITKWMWERGRGIYSDDGELVALEGFVTDITDRKEREGVLTALHDIAVDIATYETVEGICERTVAASRNLLQFDLCVIDIEEDGYLRKAAISEDVPLADTATMRVDEGIAGKTFRTGESMVVEDVRTVEEANPQGPYRSGISISIGDHGVFQAVAEEPDAFDESDRELAELLVSHATNALDRIDREREVGRQNERLERFATVVSHDLRGPLTVAKGRLEIVRDERDSEDLRVVADSLDRMQTLVEDTLALARRGRTVDDPEPVGLASLAEACWTQVATSDATVEILDPPAIRGDPDRVRTVFENLFRNAVEHGGEGVTVRVDGLEGGFYVADDGPGIPVDERELAFEPGRTTTDEGTGFGLAIVAEIVEAHGWSVDVVESADGGARFEITGVETVR